jgi:hypothetical protein
MNKYLFIALIISTTDTDLWAQNPVNIIGTTSKMVITKEEHKTTAPLFKFLVADNTHDYGTIPEGPNAVYEFQFVNVGNAPLLISNAQASCGCTSPEFPKSPILPGKKGKITVTYTTKGHPGNFAKSVYLSSNAQTNDGAGHYELKIKGIVIAAQK